MSLFDGCPRSGSIGEVSRPDRAVLSAVSRLAALIVLAALAPSLLCVALLVARSSEGPVLVRKAYRRAQRCGLVYLYEFRTECWGSWTETPVGALLTRTGIHRLPRIVNLLTGDVVIGEQLERT